MRLGVPYQKVLLQALWGVVPNDKEVVINFSACKRVCFGSIYAWVQGHQEEVWSEALLTKVNIEQFVVMSNQSRVSNLNF